MDGYGHVSRAMLDGSAKRMQDLIDNLCFFADCGIGHEKSPENVDSQGFLFVPEVGLEPAHF